MPDLVCRPMSVRRSSSHSGKGRPSPPTHPGPASAWRWWLTLRVCTAAAPGCRSDLGVVPRFACSCPTLTTRTKLPLLSGRRGGQAPLAADSLALGGVGPSLQPPGDLPETYGTCLNDASMLRIIQRGVPAARPLSCTNLVGRDGIEPPTLRFSAG